MTCPELFELNNAICRAWDDIYAQDGLTEADYVEFAQTGWAIHFELFDAMPCALDEACKCAVA